MFLLFLKNNVLILLNFKRTAPFLCLLRHMNSSLRLWEATLTLHYVNVSAGSRQLDLQAFHNIESAGGSARCISAQTIWRLHSVEMSPAV